VLVITPDLVGVAVGTLVSEDVATVAAAALVSEGRASVAAAAVSCIAGVYAGDLGLWLAGRLLGRRILTLSCVARRVNSAGLERLADRIDAHLGVAVLSSRVLPGSRLPMYLAAGIWGRRPVAFAGWSFLAVLLWTPVLLLTALTFGGVATSVFLDDAESLWHHVTAGIALLLILRRVSKILRSRWPTTLSLVR
jgi:membrane protein DedA with SNARE-associated domain